MARTVTALLIALALAGCASWNRCAEQWAGADNTLLAPTGLDAADAAASGLWLAVQLGCVTRESVRATPPPAAPAQ